MDAMIIEYFEFLLNQYMDDGEQFAQDLQHSASDA
jgi:hypothetical protein